MESESALDTDFSSPVPQQFVVMTTSGSTSGDKVGIMTSLGLQWLKHIILYALSRDDIRDPQ